ncbi:MAG: S24 family peptidase, partial [bacterium]
LIERNGEVPENGTIVLADYDGGMIKRFFKEGDNIILKSENPDYTDIRISPREAAEKDFRIAGRVKNIWRDI